MLDQPAQRVADGTAVATGALAAVSLSQVNEVVSIVAGLVAIVTGVCAIVWYVLKIRQARRDQ